MDITELTVHELQEKIKNKEKVEAGESESYSYDDLLNYKFIFLFKKIPQNNLFHTFKLLCGISYFYSATIILILFLAQVSSHSLSSGSSVTI